MASDELLLFTVSLLTIVMGLVASRSDLGEEVFGGSWKIVLRRWLVNNSSSEAHMLYLAFAGLGLFLIPNLLGDLSGLGGNRGGLVLSTMSALAFLQWLAHVNRVTPGKRSLAPVIRVGQMAVASQAVTVVFPAASLLGTALLMTGLLLAIGVACALIRRGSPEARRLKGMMLALPLFAVAFALGPRPTSAVLVALGTAFFLISAGHQFVNDGRRLEFMGRFLSAQVRNQVRERGMSQALHQAQYEISVVSCDLRGFTAFSQAHASGEVVEVLKRYYDAVSTAVAGFEATIKDFAGDGILILVGAPLPMPDHAARSLELARQVREQARAAIAPWSGAPDHLGLGIGVATGVVTVGVIESVSRIEYAAVGPAVNLAARLCAAASDGEVRVDQRTAKLAGIGGLLVQPDLSLKGYAERVPNFVLA
ncbi:MAG TPA: adenylate/guanylate cyclase domain-containing protein [Verrucomicrobiae bacterium]|nr:adenylate/guanylate cyclase domain-containing protein [Verrucomicrobiae bacterium]